MRKLSTLALVLGLAASLVLTGCTKKVEVQTGTRVMCTYGHQISSDVRTIEVPADKAGSYRVRTITRKCDLHKRLEDLYGKAQAALAAGDTANARKLLQDVVKLDPTFHSAKRQLDTILKGGTPPPDSFVPSIDSTPTAGGGSGTPTTPPGPGTGSDTPAAGLLSWTPDVLEGFTAVRPSIEAFSVTREYLPPRGSNVLTLVIVAEQFRDAGSAAVALDRQVKAHYTRNVTTPTINGRKGYSATDGRRYAIYAFTDHSVMVVVEASLRSGSVTALTPVVEGVAKQLP